MKLGRYFDCYGGVMMVAVDIVFRVENGIVSVVAWVVKGGVDRMDVHERIGPWRALGEVMSGPSLDDKKQSQILLWRKEKGSLGFYSILDKLI